MKTILSICLLLWLTLPIYAQDTTETWDDSKSNGGFAEKFGKKIQKGLENLAAKQNAPVDAQISQSLESYAKLWPTNNKLVTYSPYFQSDMLKGGKYVYIKLEKDTNGFVGPINVSFFLNEDKTLSDPDEYKSWINPMYTSNKWFFTGDPFVMEYYKDQFCLYVTDKSIVCYRYEADDSPVVKDVEWIAGKKGKNLTSWIKEIEAWRRFGFDKEKQDQVDLQEAEIAFRQKYSLENKVVTDLKVVFTDDSESSGALAGGSVNFGVEVTLSDGTKDKTQNLGGNLYIEDFVTDFETTNNIGEDYKNDQWGGHCHCAEAKLQISKFAPKPGARDIITFTVKPKYAGSASQEITLPILYTNEIAYYSSGRDLKVMVKTTKHSETGEELLYCKSGNSYKKLKVNGTLIADVSGAPGQTGYHGADCYGNYCHAENSGNGGDGGDAGNINVIVTSTGKGKFKTDLRAYGGSGGMPGVPGHALNDNGTGTDGTVGLRGSSGSDGYTNVKVGSVSF